MTTTAPLSFGTMSLSDPEETLKVTNNGRLPLSWPGTRRVYTIRPNETAFIPFHVVVRYLGDPRSGTNQVTYKTTTGEQGVIPNRKNELNRLSVWYGVYQAEVRNLPKAAPKVTVLNYNDVPIAFPIFDAGMSAYGFDSNDTPMTDIRTELEYLRAQSAQANARIDQLSTMEEEPTEVGDATADTPPGR